jgi:FMN-dependent NADH-azoreductase
MKLLRIDSSARRSSVSRQLTGRFVEAWKQEHPNGQVIERDLARTNIPPITDEFVQAMHTDPGARNTEQVLALAVSDTLIEEVLAADIIVVGVPMYNFSIPAPLKAWIDQVVRVGKTLRYGASGPEGLVKGKKVYVLTSRGGAYQPGTPTQRFDYQEPYLRHILAYIGLTDVTFIHAENQLRSSDAAELARAAAIAQIEQFAASERITVAQ